MCDAGALLDFVTAVFGAKISERILDDTGTVRHAEFQIGESLVMCGRVPEEAPVQGATLYVYCSDCDEVYAQALEAVGSLVREPGDQFYGDRTAAFGDPQGNEWYLATRKETLSEAAIQARMDQN